VRTIVVFNSFNASHSLVLADGMEPVHAHKWNVKAEIEHDGAEAAGNAASLALAAVISPLHGTHLNELGELAPSGASAEALARCLHRLVKERLAPLGLSLLRITVEEEPGCWATFTDYGE
jgi:6-pyruvoyl-tetrahydropterin synthase